MKEGDELSDASSQGDDERAMAEKERRVEVGSKALLRASLRLEVEQLYG